MQKVVEVEPSLETVVKHTLAILSGDRNAGAYDVKDSNYSAAVRLFEILLDNGRIVGGPAKTG